MELLIDLLTKKCHSSNFGIKVCVGGAGCKKVKHESFMQDEENLGDTGYQR